VTDRTVLPIVTDSTVLPIVTDRTVLPITPAVSVHSCNLQTAV